MSHLVQEFHLWYYFPLLHVWYYPGIGQLCGQQWPLIQQQLFRFWAPGVPCKSTITWNYYQGKCRSRLDPQNKNLNSLNLANYTLQFKYLMIVVPISTMSTSQLRFLSFVQAHQHSLVSILPRDMWAKCMSYLTPDNSSFGMSSIIWCFPIVIR